MLNVSDIVFVINVTNFFFYLIKVIRARIKYPKNVNSGVPGEYYEILFKSEFLLFSNANRNGVAVYGTDHYMISSDLLKGICIKNFSLVWIYQN